MKILFIGGPLHMQTKEFDGRAPNEYQHPMIADPGREVDPMKTQLRVVRYRLRKASVDQPVPPFYTRAPTVLDFQVYVAEGETESDYPEAARYLVQMWPEISAGRGSSSSA